ncbi:hypothetical protein DM01DRAFT_1338463 [Hesseltinella vesiculosa]|uniref:Zn(2)-C6 fungal-type domain-containing protein n=1 Tax=Hesseltinella vesiculosa TaxID=101127 RepID=A0A1X2G9X4_9FUNG|nr:hypothetical protein DM01DRAFT_1338463 [Hesseltinella vesiculosa]
MACESCRSRKVYCDLGQPCCAQCSRTKRQCLYLAPTIHVREEDVGKLSTALADLDGSFGHLQQDLTQLMASVHESMTMARATPQPRPIIHKILHLNGEECHLHVTDNGISIEFRTENICFQTLMDMLYASLMIAKPENETLPLDIQQHIRSKAPMTSGSSPTLKLQKVPLYTSPALIFRALYNIGPSLHSATLASGSMTSSTTTQLLDIFLKCYVGHQIVNKPNFRAKFLQDRVPDFLRNAILAWSCRHAAVFHNAFPGLDSDQVGEVYYDMAKDQLTEFMFRHEGDADCVFGLLLLYGYHVGKASPTLSCRLLPGAYVQLGLSMQIALSLKMHAPHPELPVETQETYRRLWSLLYFLDALIGGQTESKASMMIPQNEITVTPQSPLASEDMETSARVQYACWRTEIRRCYRAIYDDMKGSEVALATVLELHKDIERIAYHLDHEVEHLSPGRRHGASFSAEGYYKLRIETHLLKIQLYFPMIQDASFESAEFIDASAICLQSALAMVHLIESDAQSKSPWCLFSVEASWAATAVLKHIGCSGSAEEQQLATASLASLQSILTASPIALHPPMAKLLEYIDRQASKTVNTL